MRFVRLARQGKYTRPDYRARFSPFTDIVSLLFLVLVVILMAFDYPIGTWTLLMSLLMWPALTWGWFKVRDRVEFISRSHVNYEKITGEQAPDIDPPRRNP